MISYAIEDAKGKALHTAEKTGERLRTIKTIRVRDIYPELMADETTDSFFRCDHKNSNDDKGSDMIKTPSKLVSASVEIVWYLEEKL